jgi:hypothetical protein
VRSFKYLKCALTVDMKGTYAAALVASLLVFVFSRHIPNSVLKLVVGNYVGVALLLVAVIVAAKYDLVLSIGVFLVVGSLFLENRKRVLMTLRPSKGGDLVKVPDGAPVQAIVAGSEDVIDGEAHPDQEVPETDSYKFEPSDDATDKFSSVGESIDMKAPLETASANSNTRLAQHLTREGLV